MVDRFQRRVVESIDSREFTTHFLCLVVIMTGGVYILRYDANTCSVVNGPHLNAPALVFVIFIVFILFPIIIYIIVGRVNPRCCTAKRADFRVRVALIRIEGYGPLGPTVVALLFFFFFVCSQVR